MTVSTLRKLTAKLGFTYDPAARAQHRQYQAATQRTRQAVTGLAAANASLAASQAAVNSAVGGTIKQMGGYAAVLGLAFGGREVLQAADDLDELNNRLRAVVGNTVPLEDLRRSLTRLSVENFQNIEDTTQVFQRFKIGTEDVGVPIEDILTFTDSVQKSAALSGATATETNAALIQFAQGIASNRFSGEELRSVSEQLPTLLRVLKRDLGLTTGELRELAFAGGLTADVIFTAFDNQRETILKEFENIQVTQQKAAENMRTALFTFFGKFGQGVGLNRVLTKFYQVLATGLLNLEDAAFKAGLAFRGLFVLINDFSNTVFSVLTPIFALFKGNGLGAFFDTLSRFLSTYNTLRRAGQGAGEAFNNTLGLFFSEETAAAIKKVAQGLVLIGKFFLLLTTARMVKGLAKGVGSVMGMFVASKTIFAGLGGLIRGALKPLQVFAFSGTAGLAKMAGGVFSLTKAFGALKMLGLLLLRTVFSPLTFLIVGLQAAMAAFNKPNSKLKALWERLVELWNGVDGEGIGAAFERLGKNLLPLLTMGFNALVTIIDTVAGALLGIINGLAELWGWGQRILGLDKESNARRSAQAQAIAAERGAGTVTINGVRQVKSVDYDATSRGQGRPINASTNTVNLTVTPEQAAEIATLVGSGDDRAFLDALNRAKSGAF